MTVVWQCGKNIVCCKLKYPGGGFDFVKTTENKCRNNIYFHDFSNKDNSLCFEWKEDDYF